MSDDRLLMAFVGDDFTGSTDAMESLARRGIKTILFTAPPTREQLARHPDLRAFGIASTTRSMPPDEMEQTLRPVFQRLRELAVPLVHYKVCSTFDSSPAIGSIGRVIDVGIDVFGRTPVPIVVGAPALGRYCVFGNLFARSGAESEPFRLDRHPSMSRHPVTPMEEADLRVHLSRQTSRSIELIDVMAIENGNITEKFERIAEKSAGAVLIDCLFERHLEAIGRLLDSQSRDGSPLFVVGSSSVEAAIATQVSADREEFRLPRAGRAGPIVAVCGSRSPVTHAQIRFAVEHGFVEISELNNAVAPAAKALREGKSVVIHSRDADASVVAKLGTTLGSILRNILPIAEVRRVLIAGGDTSGQFARALGIESMQMIAELTRGSPLVRVSAPGSPADGIEMTFKGGQIGKVDFFTQVEQGRSDV